VVNGLANTLRPDVTGPIKIIGSVERWFDTSVFLPVARFGNLGRNAITGPSFHNTDFSVTKNTLVGEGCAFSFGLSSSISLIMQTLASPAM